MHGAVRDAVRDAYAHVYKSRPELRFVYGESGWPWGGRFPPHKTHANGTSVDFFVPVRSEGDKVAEVPTSLLNRYGYDLRFDKSGRYGGLKLDFEAMGEHLLALDKAARAHGIRIRRVHLRYPPATQACGHPGRRRRHGADGLHQSPSLGAALRALPRGFRGRVPVGATARTAPD